MHCRRRVRRRRILILTTQTTFADLGLDQRLLGNLAAENYSAPTPVQAQTIPALLDGRDVLGVAQTGTGKTAAFSLPLLHRLAANRQRPARGGARALVLAPTRELAVQINEACRTYGRSLGQRTAVVVGGVPKGKQVRALSRGVDILIATPGRLMDLMNDRSVQLNQVTTLVLDEADRMLDMGFIHDVRKIAGMLPDGRQSMLFSATMPREIEKLANELLNQPVRVEVSPQTPAVERIDQRVFHIAQPEKRGLLSKLLRDPELSRVIVFTRTKHGADRLARQLETDGVETGVLHGNKTQGARQQALTQFRNGKARVLVATDIAARGIDVDGVTHVVNYELPNVPESYVHRIGRTARAGAEGVALSFCDPSEQVHLRGIERLTKQRLTVIGDAPRRAPRQADNRKSERPANGKPGRPKRRRNANGQSNGRRMDAERNAA
ncbi:ATP-dependent helicase [Ferruginivarius sediminum]|uniref:DEAD-box ATP-dependent RNA helicase RhpA n=1 Tax=Ferruginivarius sediminum TaxID=2661937 RepID=A0A369T7S1_9PROT|nr:ATP-dependent helicase [Ferruginivarius sediminum]